MKYNKVIFMKDDMTLATWPAGCLLWYVFFAFFVGAAWGVWSSLLFWYLSVH